MWVPREEVGFLGEDVTNVRVGEAVGFEEGEDRIGFVWGIETQSFRGF